jgi:hypothetical protein
MFLKEGKQCLPWVGIASKGIKKYPLNNHSVFFKKNQVVISLKIRHYYLFSVILFIFIFYLMTFLSEIKK